MERVPLRRQVSSTSPILANDFRALWQKVGGDVQRAVARVGESGWLILGKEVTAFEQSLARLWGLEQAVGCGNGMDAIEIALRVLGLKPGDPVLTTPLSAFATTLAILRAGGRPVFVDVTEAGGLDLSLSREVLTKHPEIKFMVPVHLYGHVLDLDELERLREDLGLKIVEDCAQSILGRQGGRNCGTVGQCAATSFYPTKNLGAMGDGGALLTNDPELAAQARRWRDYGQAAKYVHVLPGLNSRLDELQAAILNHALLPRLDRFTETRRAIARGYYAGLGEVRALEVPVTDLESSVWHLFPVLARGDRARICEHLASRSIQTAFHYPQLIPDQQAMQPAAFEVATPLSVARRWTQHEISLPLHPFLGDVDVQRVIAACRELDLLRL